MSTGYKVKHSLSLRIVKFLNALLMTAPFAYIWYAIYADHIAAPFYRKGNWMIIFLFFLIYVFCGRVYDAFMISYYRISEVVYSQMLSAVMANAMMFMVTWLLKKHWPKLRYFFLVLAMELVVSVVWTFLAHRWYFRSFPAQKTFIVWDMREGMTELIDSYGLSKKFNVVGDCSAAECVQDLSVLDGMKAVFLSGVHSTDRNVIIKYCVEHNIRAFIIPRIGDVMMSGAHKMHLFHLPMLRLERYNPSPEFLFFKRLFDIVLSLLAIVVLSPVMGVTALLIKREDHGPVLYKQARLTRNGKVFDVYKFRSMRTDAEKDGVAKLSTGANDDRITKVGKVIRAVRIDELPQLFNILQGDMSIVGPRPERPEIAEQYEEELPEFRLRLQAKCGLTGYAQVYGKYNTTPYDKLQMDLMYIANPSLLQDLRIIFATIKILFMKESTEGFATDNPEGNREKK